MLDIIRTKKEKTRVFLFFKLYKMVLNILNYEINLKKKLLNNRF